MTLSSPTDLLATFAQNSDALDRLILSDAFENSGFQGDVLLLEDANLSLTSAAFAQLIESDARIFFRARSYALTQKVLEFKEQLGDSLRHRLIIADASTLDILSFLKQHSFTGRFAIGRLPKSHGALADWAQDFAAYQQAQHKEATMILGGNTKHMSKNFNETLAQHFHTVQGLRGKGKHRSLLASVPKVNTTMVPSNSKRVGLGGVFSGAKADLGGQLLATCTLDILRDNTFGNNLTVVDFGCGNGSVSQQILENEPAASTINKLIATDIDADAIRSSQLNLAPFSQVQFLWDDAASSIAENSVDLVLLNPPFHEGTRVDLTMVQPLLDSSWHLLKPGGTLLLVHNSHARYRPEVEKRFGQVQQVSRSKIFTVIRAQKQLS